ncbi:MAG: 3-ketoacyl-ACP reductase [Planctomycetota bacterium]|nr:MAG: 3-ketoacyl-ACP reductase [Planctomycetota bacterium]
MNDHPVALITGGTRGIGRGIADALAERGFDLVLTGQRPHGEVADIIRQISEVTGRRAEYLSSDVASPADRSQLLTFTRQTFGRLDVLVNNAGITSVGRRDILDADEASFDRVMAVNAKGPFFLTQSVARWMIEQKRNASHFRGCIVNVTSISAEFVSTNRGDYCISKAALSMATRLWAARLGEFDIPVYEVRPGIIRSDMTAAAKDKYDRLLADGLAPQRRWGEPRDVGRAVAALACGLIPYATGQVLTVDGGMHIPRL